MSSRPLLCHSFQRCETMTHGDSDKSTSFEEANHDFTKLLGQLIARRWLAATDGTGSTPQVPEQDPVAIEAHRDTHT
jgi:hypothetical protein